MRTDGGHSHSNLPPPLPPISQTLTHTHTGRTTQQSKKAIVLWITKLIEAIKPRSFNSLISNSSSSFFPGLSGEDFVGVVASIGFHQPWMAGLMAPRLSLGRLMAHTPRRSYQLHVGPFVGELTQLHSVVCSLLIQHQPQ